MGIVRLRRRLIILLVLTLAVFAYVRKEIFFQQAKKLIRQNLEKNLSCQLSIGDIRIGRLYGLVLENLEVSFPQVAELEQAQAGPILKVKVNKAIADYNFWKSFFSSGHKDVRRLRLVSPAINISYSSGLSNLSSASGQGSAAALPEAFAYQKSQQALSHNDKRAAGDFVFILEEGRISFGKGEILLLKNLQGSLFLNQEGLYFQDIKANFNDSSANELKLYGHLKKDYLSLNASLEHLQVGDFDILTNLALILDRKLDPQNKSPKTDGTLKSYGSVFNNQPFPELTASFEIQDRQLRILSFSLGNSYDLRGIVDLKHPFNADLSLNFYQAALNELVWQFISAAEKPDFSGRVNGLIKISGALGCPKVEGFLEAKQGHIGDLAFVSADINLKGRYPRILLVDSRILREEDSFLMEGEIDFTNLEKQGLLDITVKGDKGMLWQGWDITRGGENQVHMSKNVADDVKVTFDTFIDDAAVEGYEDDYRNELGLEYRILGDKLLKLYLKKDEGILGLERRVKF
jgi:hypothetical protein